MIDAQFEAIADVNRRRILVELLDRTDGRGVTYAEIEGTAGTRGGRIETTRELTELHHVHLPKLENLGYVEWDQEAALVRKGDRYPEIRPLLELLDDHREELRGDL